MLAPFIKLTADQSGSLSRKDPKPELVNLAHVMTVSPTQDGIGSKLTFVDGRTKVVEESRDLIERLIKEEPVGTYHEPVAKDA